MTTCRRAKPAFVVVDMQNYFCPGQQVEIPTAREIVPQRQPPRRGAARRRRAGGWIRTISNEDSLTNWSHFHDVLNTPERKGAPHGGDEGTAPSARSCGRGSMFVRKT